jgi:uncharacterized membrane protein YoaK (UPF0700 family)
MVSTSVSIEILKRRAGFDAWVFAFGVSMFAFIAVPLTAYYLRSWRVVLYYFVALILLFIVMAVLLEGSDQSASFAITLIIAIPLNVAYAYAVVYQLKGEAKEAIKVGEAPKSSIYSAPESISTETKILRALADSGKLTVGHICAATGCSAVDVETELKKLVEMGLVSRTLSHNNPPSYHVI